MIDNSDLLEECNELRSGFARRQSDNCWVHIASASKEDGDLYCEQCLSPVNIRRPIEKVDHFYHFHRQSKIGARESDLHIDCKNSLKEYLHQMYPDGLWATERRINAINAVPDVSGRVGNQRLVIEVQRSTLSIKKIKERSEKYRRHQIPVLWVVPLEDQLGSQPYRPRLFERYLHAMYGCIYYWTKDSPTQLIGIQLTSASRYIELSQFYEDGELVEFGGYEQKYKSIFTPLIKDTVDVAKPFQTRFIGQGTTFIGKTTLPNCWVYFN